MRSALDPARDRPFRLGFLWMTAATLMGAFSCSSNDGGPSPPNGGSPSSTGGAGGTSTTGGGAGTTGGTGPTAGGPSVERDSGTPQPVEDARAEASPDPGDAGATLDAPIGPVQDAGTDRGPVV